MEISTTISTCRHCIHVYYVRHNNVPNTYPYVFPGAFHSFQKVEKWQLAINTPGLYVVMHERISTP